MVKLELKPLKRKYLSHKGTFDKIVDNLPKVIDGYINYYNYDRIKVKS